MLRRLPLLVWTLAFTSVLSAEPFWGSKTSEPVDTASNKLKPGQFIWKGGDNLPKGSMMTVINIPDQKIYFYNNDILMGISTISTGRGRRSTPTGVFSVLEKNRYYRSRKYHNAPMPYMQSLTTDGIAMHAGNLPGYPASHGCIRLPTQFARLLFEASPLGMPVVIMSPPNEITEPAVPTVAQNVRSNKLTPAQQFQAQNKEPAVQTPAETEALTEVGAYRDEIKKMQAEMSKMKSELAKIEKQL